MKGKPFVMGNKRQTGDFLTKTLSISSLSGEDSYFKEGKAVIGTSDAEPREKVHQGRNVDKEVEATRMWLIIIEEKKTIYLQVTLNVKPF